MCGEAVTKAIGSLEAIGYIAVSSVGLINNRTRSIDNVALPSWQKFKNFPIPLDQLVMHSFKGLRTDLIERGLFEVVNDCTAFVIGERFGGTHLHPKG